MPNDILTMADLPVQYPAAPQTVAEGRARYFNSGNAFKIVLPPVPPLLFTAEAAQVLDPDAPSMILPCDASGALGLDYPATAPFVLARYLRLCAGQALADTAAASGLLHYVIAGQGRVELGGEVIAWRPGNLFTLPGGVPYRIESAADAVLWIAGNDPLLAFEALRAPETALTGLVHYPAAEIAAQLARLDAIPPGPGQSGLGLIFSSDQREAARNVLPSLTLSLNTLPPGEFQPPHRHNAVAVMLVVQGEGCYSLIDGQRVDWSPWATMVTPPGAVHSHHNDGGRRADFLIVQDGGLHQHARTMDFAFV
jgi:quercetin dioxygenase-like cupin family protein